MSEPTCPTPAKSRFATENAAQLAAARYGKTLHTYECPCGWYHLTSKPAPPEPIEDPTVTQHVAALDDQEFTLLAGSEVRGEATAQQAAALRNRINLNRWIKALGEIDSDLCQQLVSRQGDYKPEIEQWRRRILRVQRALSERRAEAKQLRKQLNLAKGREKERLRLEGLTGAEARAAVGELAVQRLIDNHQGEFGRLLTEEFEKAGLEVPARVARHTALNAAAGAA